MIDKAIRRSIRSFHTKFICNLETGCWKWTKSVSHNGYGQFKLIGYPMRAHRMSYIMYKGAIPEGMCICHTCDNPKCVNPDHLWLGSIKDNLVDCKMKKRNAFGIKHHATKLSMEQVKKIREEYVPRKVSTYKLAQKYGINQSTIHELISGKIWKHV